MPNTELTKQIVQLLRDGYTQKEIAVQLRKHRNTIYNHLKQIRQQQVREIHEIVNMIDDKLTRELNQMTHRELINYRRALSPEPIKTITQVEGGQQPIVVKMWKPEEDVTADND